jgi:COMPASS component SWD3
MNYSLVSQDISMLSGGSKPINRVVDLDDPQLKEEILLLIANYLMENGFSASSHTLLDEASLKVRALLKDRSTFRSMSKAVVAGNWAEVETLLKQVSTTNQGPKMKGLRYSVYRQQFLEMVDKGESQKAFTYLLGNLKPMPNISSEDLHALTVMLTCRNVAESDPSWPGVAASREALANQVLSLGVADLATTDAPPDITQIVPPRRLNVLLEQAVLYQRGRSDAGSPMSLPCRSLLRDYEATCSRVLLLCFAFRPFDPALQVPQHSASAACEETACTLSSLSHQQSSRMRSLNIFIAHFFNMNSLSIGVFGSLDLTLPT